MKAWIKLAAAVLSGAGLPAIFSLAVDAIFDDNSTGEKLDALIREPYETAGRLLGDAQHSQSKAYRFECLRASRENFIKAHNLEKGFWVFDNGFVQSIEMEKASRIIRASYYAGVCADLLSESAVSLRDYENAYATAMAVEGQLWTTSIHNGMSTARRAQCIYPRRLVLKELGLTFGWLSTGWIGGSLQNFSLMPVSQADLRKALGSLYEVMQPISDLLHKRGSRLQGLAPSKSLVVSDEKNSEHAAERYFASECNWPSR